jgi:hypothetical protein
MKLSTLQFSLWGASFLAHALLASIMLWCRSYQRWPFIFALSIFELLLEALLFSLLGPVHYAAFFYVYWVAAVVRALIGIGILFDIVRSIPGISYTPANIGIGFISAALVMASGSAWLASHGGSPTFHITMLVLSLDRCIAVTWGTFAVVMFWSIRFCGLGWTITSLRLGSAFLVMTLISGTSAYSMSAWPNFASSIDEAESFFHLGILLYFSLSLYREHPSEASQGFEQIPDLARTLLPTRTQPQTEKGSKKWAL